mgnify:CR=1 FL=1
MDWTQYNEMEEIDLDFNRCSKKVRFEKTEELSNSSEFENKLNELLKIQERINVIINELHILYNFKE